MGTILAMTVGGSCAPVITAVRGYRPDFVCFIASSGPHGSRATVDGPGRPCRGEVEAAPSIVAQLGLGAEQYRVVELPDPDAFSEVYAACWSALRGLMAEFPEARYIADYTGGSKTMTAGLVLAALECGWQLSLVRGQRPDLVRVADGTELAGLVNAWDVRARQLLEEARRLFNDYAYASAGALLESLVRQAPLPAELDRTIRDWIAYGRGFDAWDRFDHARAAQILATVPGEAVPWPFLSALAGRTQGTGYEAVLDLVRNAERRAARGRYDDAVARLYRACELLAQVRLRRREPPLDSSNLDLERLPADLRPRYIRMRELNEMRGWGPEVKLGLMEDYILLADLDDPLGRVFDPLKARLQEALRKRNHSILAHGGEPLDSAGYREMRAVVGELIEAGLAALEVRISAPQFPLLVATGLRPREA